MANTPKGYFIHTIQSTAHKEVVTSRGYKTGLRSVTTQQNFKIYIIANFYQSSQPSK